MCAIPLHCTSTRTRIDSWEPASCTVVFVMGEVSQNG
jgi:hypothetical protein